MSSWTCSAVCQRPSLRLQDFHGHILVWEDIGCCPRWHHRERLSHSRARWPATGTTKDLEQIPLQELYRQVPEDVLPPVTPPQVPAQQPIEVDDEDMQPPDQPQQSTQPPLTPPIGGLNVPLIARLTNARLITWLSGTTSGSTTALTTTCRHSSPGTWQPDDSMARNPLFEAMTGQDRAAFQDTLGFPYWSTRRPETPPK